MDVSQLLTTLLNASLNTVWYFVPLFTLVLLFNHVIRRRACIRFGHAEKKRLLNIRAGALAIMAKQSEFRSVESQGKWGSPIRKTEEAAFGIIAIMTNRRYWGFIKSMVRKILFWIDYFHGVLRAMGVMPRSVFLQ